MATTPQPEGPDAGFLRRFDAERARVLRRRIAWYCGVVLFMLSISLWGTFLGDEPGEAPGSTALDLLYDVPLVVLYWGACVYVLAGRPDRHRLVLAVTALTVIACGFATAMEPIASGVPIGAGPSWRAGLVGLGASTALMTGALLLVPMTLRELLRIAGPALGVYAVVLFTVLRPGWGVGLSLLLLFALAAAPGVAWSRWRYREFDERFRAGELRGRLGEISSELAYARRLHEALFPPPIERGAVRMSYVYEPMREIGGDFLFAHPLAFPPSGEPGPLSVALIDVSGHGVPAALAVNRLHGELRRFFAASPDGSPGELIAALNAYAYAELAGQAMYASALCLRIDPVRRVLEWASAGHPTAYLRRATDRTEDLPPTAVMLGVLPPEAFEAGARSTPIAPGDAAVAFTDGATDAADDTGRPLGSVRARAAAAGAPPDHAAAAVAGAVRAHRSGAPADDTLIVQVLLAPVP
ncbi:MAG: serine/threonine-protein phosphatase [Phycisphaerales bacterium]|nr:serine/threonine-protein phosphatase [Phycisphaerales bacterium]